MLRLWREGGLEAWRLLETTIETRFFVRGASRVVGFYFVPG